MWERLKTWWRDRKVKRLVLRVMKKYGPAQLRDGLVQQGYVLVSQETTANGWIATLKRENLTVIIEDTAGSCSTKRRSRVTGLQDN